MTRPIRCSSWLASEFEAFVRLRRATGSDYTEGMFQLERFDRYLQEHAREPPLPPGLLFEFLESRRFRSPRSRDNVVSVLWPALGHARRHGAAVPPLPRRPPLAPRGTRVQPPRVLSKIRITALLKAARALPPQNALRPATIGTLIGLQLCTGLRIGEAVALDVGDVDVERGLLSVRRGKFGKMRFLPLRPSTVAALRLYIDDPRRPIDTTSSQPFFVSGGHRRLSKTSAYTGFRAAVQRAGIPSTERPRPHDLRHTFTVQTVASWYATGRDIANLLPALSTYLGHVSVEHTRCYLKANALLLEHARRLFENRTPSLWGTP